MDITWQSVDLDSQRAIGFFYHGTATPEQMVRGTHTDGFDLTPFVARASQSNSELTFTLTWHQELYGVSQAQAGKLIEVRLDNVLLWWGIIDSLSEYRHESGKRSLTLVARSRDASPAWRSVKRITQPWPVQTPLNVIADSILAELGLTPIEIDLPHVATTTVHSNTQLADMTAWEMLEAVMIAVGGAPYVNAKGIFKTINHDTTRKADIILTPERIKSVSSSRSRLAPSKVIVKWLSPSLTTVTRQEIMLWQQTVTFGYFQQKLKVPVLYSDDKTQRVENVRFVIKESIKGSPFTLGGYTERFEEVSIYEGRLILVTPFDVGQFFLYFGVAVAAMAEIPDEVPEAPGFTIPSGRILMVSALLALLGVMTQIHTGSYQVWGTPFDYVYGRNTTEAYNQNTPPFAENEITIDNDFIMNEEMAQALAVRELVYNIRAAQSYNASIVDDPRIEMGDILELPDQSRLFVTGYRRDLTPGAPAILDIEGFRV